MDIETEELIGLMNFTQQESIKQTEISIDDFLNQGSLNKYNYVIVDRPIYMSSLSRMFGHQGTLKFINGGCLCYELSQDTLYFDYIDTYNLLCDFQIEVNQEQPFLKVHGLGLEITQCTIIAHPGNPLIIFSNCLIIQSCFIKGHRQLFQFVGESIELNVSDTVLQLIGINLSNITDGKIVIQNNQFEGGNEIIFIENARELELEIIRNNFKQNKMAIQILNIKSGQIVIEFNKIESSNQCGIILENLNLRMLNINDNIILMCQIGMKLIEVLQGINLNDEIILKPIMFHRNIIIQSIQTGIIIKKVLCIDIKSCRFQENVIGLDILLSTETKSQYYEITLNNCMISNNQIHGLFLSANIQDYPIYLLLSFCTIKQNMNAAHICHFGQGPKRMFQITIYNSQIEDNKNSDIVNEYFDLKKN
ncbi:hypothetical protein pb186bvf_002182 [Paramecium bursaria]